MIDSLEEALTASEMQDLVFPGTPLASWGSAQLSVVFHALLYEAPGIAKQAERCIALLQVRQTMNVGTDKSFVTTTNSRNEAMMNEDDLIWFKREIIHLRCVFYCVCVCLMCLVCVWCV